MGTNFNQLRAYTHATRLGIMSDTETISPGNLPVGSIDDGTIPRDDIGTMRLNSLRSKYLTANGSRFFSNDSIFASPAPEVHAVDEKIN